MPADPSDVTQLLTAWRDGDRNALDALIPIVMGELKRIAGAFLAREPGLHTLQTTALVNEAYIRLVGVQPNDWENRNQFYALAARIMRNVLVDHARVKRATRRGGSWIKANLEEALLVSEAAPGLTELDAAMISLEKFDARKCQLVELRLFAGLSNEEASQVLQVSVRTVVRDWQFAKAWLARELERDSSGSAGL